MNSVVTPVIGPASPRPPRWLWRSLWMTVAVVFSAIFLWRAAGMLTGLIMNLVIALFIALTIEPMIRWLVRHGWKRSAATGAVMAGSLLAIVAMLAMFGKMFVEQVVALASNIPQFYDQIQEWAKNNWDTELPDEHNLIGQAINGLGSDVAQGVLGIGGTVVGFIFSVTTIMLVVYYLSAAGPRFRASICRWLAPKNQAVVVQLWDIAQVKVSDYINSRVVLAILSSVFTLVFLMIIEIPYALPLALFTGVVSQFVPTIGTYIGGALPILLGVSESLTKGLAVLIFIIVYQQIENYIFSPKISEKALAMNPAVAFIMVLAFGAVFGALGAFLALPVAASIQVIAGTYLQRHELIAEAAADETSGLAKAAKPDDAATADAADAASSDQES